MSASMGRPNYTLKDLETLLFIRKDLSDLDDEHRTALLDVVNNIGFGELRRTVVQFLLYILHDARNIDPTRFLQEVFLPWSSIQGNTKTHFKRIAAELTRIGEFEPGTSEEAAHIVNVYRNVVADLFDPYLTLVVACFQFKEGTFSNIEDADIGQGERNKYDYLLKRLSQIDKGQPTFLSGYNPIIRNAVSHTGARGVEYQDARVLFRNIKRGTPPIVETVTWTHEELQTNLVLLLEGVQSIRVAVEIFGLDSAGEMFADINTLSQLLVHVFSAEQRASLREQQDKSLEAIRSSNQISFQDKTKLLTGTLHHNCVLRGMRLDAVGVSETDSSVLLEAQFAPFDASNDAQLLETAQLLTRYGILARSAFGTMFARFTVRATDETGKETLRVDLSANDLDEYIAERAGLVDLLNDSVWSINGLSLKIEVDFEKLSQSELTSSSAPLPRKPRTS